MLYQIGFYFIVLNVQFSVWVEFLICHHPPQPQERSVDVLFSTNGSDHPGNEDQTNQVEQNAQGQDCNQKGSTNSIGLFQEVSLKKWVQLKNFKFEVFFTYFQFMSNGSWLLHADKCNVGIVVALEFPTPKVVTHDIFKQAEFLVHWSDPPLIVIKVILIGDTAGMEGCIKIKRHNFSSD